MKSIIEREATFVNNTDMEVKVTQKKLLRAFVKETMKQDMLNSQIHLTSQASRGSPLEVKVHA